jgi:hypothetical protein
MAAVGDLPQPRIRGHGVAVVKPVDLGVEHSSVVALVLYPDRFLRTADGGPTGGNLMLGRHGVNGDDSVSVVIAQVKHLGGHHVAAGVPLAEIGVDDHPHLITKPLVGRA